MDWTIQGRSQGGSWGARDPPFVSNVLGKQPTTGGKSDMKMWWVTSFWHRVTPPLKNRGYAPGTIIGIYRSPKVPVRQLCQAIAETLNSIRPDNNMIILGDLNINWLVETEKRPLFNLLVRNKHSLRVHYKQLISTYTTDSKTLIDHIYTNIKSHSVVQNQQVF